MLFASAHVRITAEYGIATLWLAFPGSPVNAFDTARLAELDSALAAIEGNQFVQALVVRSAHSAGFCTGIHPDALASLATATERAHFAWLGQRVFDRLAKLPFTTIAFLDGPCLGAGLELALACDHRLCVARATTHIGWQRGVPPCLGGSVRLTQRLGHRRAAQLAATDRTLSGREARQLGLVDDAFCERRTRVELRTFLDTLERRNRTPDRSAHRGKGAAGFAAERRTFARVLFPEPPVPLAFDTLNPVPDFPAVVGLVGEDEAAATLVAEIAIRGASAILSGSAAEVNRAIAVRLARGFITPLEAEQACSRVRVATNASSFAHAGLIFLAQPAFETSALSPRAVVAVCEGSAVPRISHPRRVIGLKLADSCAELVQFPDTTADALAAAAAWLGLFDFRISRRTAHTATARAA